jgi:KDO2-lipid IV(A) lauroyltransferase
LTKSDPEGSSLVINEIRESFGICVTPISVQALREAVHRLKSGGVVVIAADVPVDRGAEMIFFRRKTLLPIGHARLAVKTGARMIVGTSQRLSDGLYRAIGLQAHQPTPSGDQDRDVIRWAQNVLFALERFIRDRPYEWFMPTPLWPEPQSMALSQKTHRPMPVPAQNPDLFAVEDGIWLKKFF